MFATGAFQILSARVLGPYEFGLLASLISIMGSIGLAISALSAIAFRSASLSSERISVTKKGWNLTSDIMYREIVYYFVPVTIAIVFLAIGLGSRVNIGSIPLAIALSVIPFSAIFAIAIGRLQAINENLKIAWLSAALAFLRLLTLLPLVLFSLGATTAVFQLMVLSIIAAILVARLSSSVSPGNLSIITFKNLMIIVIQSLFWLAQSLDLVFVQINFGDKVSGNYAAGATLGKFTVLIISIFLQFALFKINILLNNRNYSLLRLINITSPALIFSLVYTVFLFIFSPSIVHRLYGDGYQISSFFIMAQGFIGILVGLNFLYMTIGFITNSTKLLGLYLVYFVFLFILLSKESDSINSVILILALVNLTAVLGASILLKLKTKKINHIMKN